MWHSGEFFVGRIISIGNFLKTQNFNMLCFRTLQLGVLLKKKKKTGFIEENRVADTGKLPHGHNN